MVFVRKSGVGPVISSTIYDVTDGKIKFVGILNNDTKITYQTSPGKKRFMVWGENADFMEANLSAGKTYYGIAAPRMGVWKARFSLWPIKHTKTAEFNHNHERVKEIISSTKLVENTEKSKQWYEANKAKIKEAHDKYITKWNTWTPENLKRRTLRPNDNI